MTSPADHLRETADAVARLGSCPSDFENLTDEEILAAEQLIARHRRAIDTCSAWIAGQVSYRSRRELGYTGLAISKGFTSPEALIQSLSGSTRAEASKHVRVGTLLATAASPLPDGPSWLIPVAEAVADGRLSADAADAIRRGLGSPDAAVSEADLRAAAQSLVVAEVDADRLSARRATNWMPTVLPTERRRSTRSATFGFGVSPMVGQRAASGLARNRAST